MKKYFLLLLVCIGIGNVNAQLIKQDEQAQKKQADLDWYNCAFDQDGVYGVEVNKAYEFLKGKKIKKRPVVALIGTGLDVEHEDLKQAIWVNPKEKADGKDNDKNGFTDDIKGWNFLGGKDGQVMESLMQEGDREFFYQALDRDFPGIRQKYVHTYGNAYDIPSPHAKELMTLIQNTCTANGMLCSPKECFTYLHEFPERYVQQTLF